jgi:hypothetical protein
LLAFHIHSTASCSNKSYLEANVLLRELEDIP